MNYTILFTACAIVFLGAGCVSNLVRDVPDEVPVDAVSLPVPISESEEGEETIVVENAEVLGGANEPSERVQDDESVSDNVLLEPPQNDVASFSVTAKQWTFEPAVIRVKQGQRVELDVTSVDVAHGFRLPEFGIGATLEPEKTVRVSFVADKVGTFSFFCDVFCGQGHGSMRGTLVVE